MITVLLCLWRGHRPIYGPEHVQAMARMLAEHLSIPHQIVCLSDLGPVPGVETVPFPELPGLRFVAIANCWRRLRLFDPAFSAQFGTPWILPLDLDCVIVDDLAPVVESGMAEPGGFKILGGRRRHCIYNGSAWMLRVGAHARIWQEFDPAWSAREVRLVPGKRSVAFGSDQAWLELKLPDAPIWTEADGLRSFALDFAEDDTPVPPGTRLVYFAGRSKPWMDECARRAPALYDTYRDALAPG